MVAACIAEHGVEGFIIYRNHINSKMFVEIIDLIEKNGKNYVLLGDNATIHNSNYTKRCLKEKKVDFIYSVPYQPELNPIENQTPGLKLAIKLVNGTF